MKDHPDNESCSSDGEPYLPNEPTYRQLQESLRRDPAFDEILAKLYSHLRAIAASIRKSQRHATLRTTDLVHEATLKMMKSRSLEWEDEVHFQRIAAAAMKQIMIDAARRRKAEIHGGDLTRIPLEEWSHVVTPWDDSMLDLNRALDELGEKHSREAQAVDLTFFGGHTIPEAAAALRISESTAAADLRFARKFLSSRLGSREDNTGSQTGMEKHTRTAGKQSTEVLRCLVEE